MLLGSAIGGGEAGGLMWGRWSEILIALWLLASPWIVGDATLATTVACGAAALVLSMASFARRARHAHLAILPVAGWLIVHGWLGTRGLEVPPPELQNEIVAGLLLAMFAIVPDDASRPPSRWREAEQTPEG